MKKLFIVLILFTGFMNIQSQNTVVNLWDEIPNSKQTDEKESFKVTNIKRIFAVKKPTLEIFLPSKKTDSDKAVIICPGGGYGILAYD
jgi:hypothetical protein